MKILICIDIDGELCGYDCPFKSTKPHYGGTCTIFKVELEERQSYGHCDGLIRCDECLIIKDTSKDK